MKVIAMIVLFYLLFVPLFTLQCVISGLMLAALMIAACGDWAINRCMSGLEWLKGKL
jgi:hypothetical protein